MNNNYILDMETFPHEFVQRAMPIIQEALDKNWWLGFNAGFLLGLLSAFAIAGAFKWWSISLKTRGKLR